MKYGKLGITLIILAICLGLLTVPGTILSKEKGQNWELVNPVLTLRDGRT